MALDILRPGDPARLGRYRLASRLGSGGQGVVYEGYDEAANRVAVKVLHAYLPGDSPLRRRFAREVTAARQVASFCTARVLDHDLDGERPYIVSEFVPGPSLRAAVERAPFSGDALHRLAVGVATALAAIHQAGVVHRDLKPENVLLGPDGPRVIDFGIARAPGLSLTSTGELAGTPMYMAPELFHGGRAEPAADVFAWGAVLLFAATGRDAFAAPATFAVVNRLINDEPDTGVLPERLGGLARAALSKDPAARPSAHRLLRGLLDGGGHAILVKGAQAAAGVRPSGSPDAEPALGAVAEQVYGTLSPAEREMARDLLLRLVDVAGGDEMPRAAAADELTEVGDLAGDVLATLERSMLLRRQDGTVTIGSAALLYAWPRLHEWVTGDREALRRHRELGAAARRWARDGRRPEDLLRGGALSRALDWAAATRLTLNATERAFVEASRIAAARQHRRRRLVSTGVSALLVAALTAGILAWQQSARGDEADRRLADERARAAARRVALQADALPGTDPVKAMLLSVAAYRIAPVPEAGSAVLSSLAQPERSVFTDPVPGNEARTLSPDGRTLVSAGAGRVTAYDAVTGRRLRSFTGVGVPVAAALGPDGDTLALAEGPAIELWSLRTGRRLGGGRWLPGRDGAGVRAGGVEFSPGGGYLIVKANIGGPYAGLWNVARRALERPEEYLTGAVLGPGDRFGLIGSALRSLPGPGAPPGKRLPRRLPGPVLAFSPDGTLAAVQGEWDRTTLWHLSTGKPDRRGLPGAAYDAVFSADGRFLVTVTGSAGDELAVWSLPDAAPLIRLAAAGRIVGPPRLGPGNRTLSVLDDAGKVTTYDIARHTVPRRKLPPEARSPEFTASGDMLFARTGDTVSGWSVPAFAEARRLDVGSGGRPDPRAGRLTATSPDGRTVATVAADDFTGAVLWDAASGRRLGEVPLPAEYGREDLRFSRDGGLLAVSAAAPNDNHGMGLVTVVDVARRRQVAVFRRVAAGPLSFSADGRFLVTADPAGIDVIDLAARKVVPRAQGPGTLARRWLTFAPKGPLAASPYGARAVVLWDTRTWRPAGRVLGVPGEVTGAVFSPDGRLLAVGHDTRVTVFDTTTGRALGPAWPVTSGASDPFENDAPMPAVAFTSGGAVLRVMGRDGIYREVPTGPAHVLPEVCHRAGRPLTPEEWREHIGTDLPYRDPCGTR
ncbi:hypothetical protein Sru01_07340 [Sphaerisporangium rufum]|uniref:Protein kinase domain-containing protein n=1 Tax=Sphaerisporangium rufum TaxID=1381558 RepID=A0A919QXG0_9ACTN|nr:serine/threonine-protein kinase [Sphaerisporangium rufum]GII75752.1 hypothetical protein Sru01_07340 [Sphaerisporangium rufum]